MNWLRLPSLQLRLAVRLMLLYLAATAVAVGVLVYQAYHTANSLNDRELSLRVADLKRSIAVDSLGSPRLDLSPKLAEAYLAAGAYDVFAIRGKDGRVIAASPLSFGDRVSDWPAASYEPTYFRLSPLSPSSKPYYGLSVAVDSAAGPLSISVARAAGVEPLILSLLRGFVFEIFWIIPILVAITLAISIVAIRSGLSPVREISRIAAAIGPGTASVRLPEEGLPSEITPLVRAANQAFDRLEKGFAVQREFTANAAHELRTPLSIITSALDTMEGNGELLKLKSDVRRMNRLVEQLLRVARLDAIALDVSTSVDLGDTAASVITAMAPWCIAQQRNIAFTDAEQPIWVKGNAPAIEDAIRNLVENAVAHSPLGSEVVVSVHRDGRVCVSDQGPGVPVADRQHVFTRFWRAKDSKSGGAGLGLAIVSDILEMHGGTVSVAENTGGGAVFTLSFHTEQEESSDSTVATMGTSS